MIKNNQQKINRKKITNNNNNNKYRKNNQMLTDKPQPYKLKIPDDINQKSPLRWLLIILLIVRIIYSIKLCYDEFQAFEKVNKGIFAGLNDINVGYQKEKVSY